MQLGSIWPWTVATPNIAQRISKRSIVKTWTDNKIWLQHWMKKQRVPFSRLERYFLIFLEITAVIEANPQDPLSCILDPMYINLFLILSTIHFIKSFSNLVVAADFAINRYALNISHRSRWDEMIVRGLNWYMRYFSACHLSMPSINSWDIFTAQNLVHGYNIHIPYLITFGWTLKKVATWIDCTYR